MLVHETFIDRPHHTSTELSNNLYLFDLVSCLPTLEVEVYK